MIKVCGMRESENIREVEALGIDMMGFIFYPKSSRFCEQKPSYLPSCRRVGVFVDASHQEIKSRAEDYGLWAVQLHGAESASFCDEIRAAIPGIHIIKAISVSSQDDILRTEQYLGHCDSFLFDTKCESVGGSGVSFDWKMLEEYKGSTPFLLSGGLGLENIDSLREFSHPALIGYDLNSRFEDLPAVKNIEKLTEFINRIKL